MTKQPKPVTLELAEKYLDGSKQCRPACDLAWRRVDEAAEDYDVLLENYRDVCAMLTQVCRERDELTRLRSLDITREATS